jgi:hypothetical protein
MDLAINPTKRARFDATAQPATTTENATEPKTPIALAHQQHICRHVELLLPTIATTIEILAFSHLQLLAKAYKKRTQISKMESDDDFFPHSAHLKLQLLVLKEAKESPEFMALFKVRALE